MVYHWGHNRRFNSYPEYFKKLFGGRVQKLAINAGFTCPNRDGTVAKGGCTFCSNSAFTPSYCNPTKAVSTQIEEGMVFHQFRYRRANQYLAYFQSFSNTYASLDRLKMLYEEALAQPGVIGLVIGTRPDCIDSEKLEYLAHLAEKYYITIEYGIESVNDNTLNLVNRGHDYAQSVWAIEETKKYGLNTGAHFIIGLPGETINDFMNIAFEISKLRLNTVKFHQLQIFRGTAMETDYIQNPEKYQILEMNDYLGILTQMIERINPEVVIERIASEVPPRHLVSAPWGTTRYDEVLRIFEKKLELNDTWQGRLFQ